MASHIGAPSNSKNYHTVGVMNFEKEIMNRFNDYTDEVTSAIIDEVLATAKEGCEKLRESKFPAGTQNGTAKPMKRRMWRKYASSWDTVETVGANFVKATIRNRKYYRLTHLLEYGHDTRDGNRTRAFAHVKPVEKYCVEKLEKDIPKIIEKGGKL